MPAYGELVRKHQQEIRTYLVRMTRNREIADDLAQESFLEGYRQLRQLEDMARFRPWIYAIAHREFLQWHRRRRETDFSVPEGSVAETSVTARVELESLLGMLRPEESSAVVLCLGQGLSHAEAAQALGMPLGTVKSLILRAREKLNEEA